MISGSQSTNHSAALDFSNTVTFGLAPHRIFFVKSPSNQMGVSLYLIVLRPEQNHLNQRVNRSGRGFKTGYPENSLNIKNTTSTPVVWVLRANLYVLV